MLWPNATERAKDFLNTLLDDEICLKFYAEGPIYSNKKVTEGI